MSPTLEQRAGTRAAWQGEGTALMHHGKSTGCINSTTTTAKASPWLPQPFPEDALQVNPWQKTHRITRQAKDRAAKQGCTWDKARMSREQESLGPQLPGDTAHGHATGAGCCSECPRCSVVPVLFREKPERQKRSAWNLSINAFCKGKSESTKHTRVLSLWPLYQ